MRFGQFALRRRFQLRLADMSDDLGHFPAGVELFLAVVEGQLRDFVKILFHQHGLQRRLVSVSVAAQGGVEGDFAAVLALFERGGVKLLPFALHAEADGGVQVFALFQQFGQFLFVELVGLATGVRKFGRENV